LDEEMSKHARLAQLLLVQHLTQFAEAGTRPSKAEYLLEKNIISVI
jgi:hypothetical protein